jgi:hypothetical protein
MNLKEIEEIASKVNEKRDVASAEYAIEKITQLKQNKISTLNILENLYGIENRKVLKGIASYIDGKQGINIEKVEAYVTAVYGKPITDERHDFAPSQHDMDLLRRILNEKQLIQFKKVGTVRLTEGISVFVYDRLKHSRPLQGILKRKFAGIRPVCNKTGCKHPLITDGSIIVTNKRFAYHLDCAVAINLVVPDGSEDE